MSKRTVRKYAEEHWTQADEVALRKLEAKRERIKKQAAIDRYNQALKELDDAIADLQANGWDNPGHASTRGLLADLLP